MFHPYGVSLLSVKKAILSIAYHMPEIVGGKYCIMCSAVVFCINAFEYLPFQSG